ncbi:MFS general substrate transporter [Peniophora sp. CONT]|nr:MFS general substrate transporter [Peniophora sp. CONT]
MKSMDEKQPSPIASEMEKDERHEADIDASSISYAAFNVDIVSRGDEALKLVGRERERTFSDEYNAKLRRKLDWWIPPLCAAVYFTQFLDKTSLNYASIMGFPIEGQQYNFVSMAFYLGFLLFEFPTVYISQKLRLAKYLGKLSLLRFRDRISQTNTGGNIVAWGAILMLHAVPSSFGAFFALRFLLGILIAYAISFYDGPAIASYKIVYLLLGGLAILVGIVVLLWMPDSPVHAAHLTPEERIAVLERVRDDQGGTENKKFKREQVIEAVCDVRTWLIALSTMMTSIPNGALSNFSNIVIKSFGYTTKQTLILSTPGGVVAALTTLACGYYSDKKNERMLPIVFALIPAIVGSAMLVGLNGSDNKGALLFAINVIKMYGSALAMIYAYNASNTSGHTKKLTVNVITLVSFSVGNIIGTEIFQTKDAPGYTLGKVTILVLFMVQFIVSFLLRSMNMRKNKAKLGTVQAEKDNRGWSDADVQREREKSAFLDMTDKENIFFVYTV